MRFVLENYCCHRCSAENVFYLDVDETGICVLEKHGLMNATRRILPMEEARKILFEIESELEPYEGRLRQVREALARIK